jgi:cephalosporin hydroxylase
MSYDDLLSEKKFTAENVLKVGVDGILLWHEYFPNAIVHAFDDTSYEAMPTSLKNKKRIRLISGDAYSSFLIQQVFQQKRFDFIIDDGSHMLEHQLLFLKYYSELLRDDGILIIKNIADLHYLDIFRQNTPEHLKPFIKTLINDDIMFCIDKQ